MTDLSRINAAIAEACQQERRPQYPPATAAHYNEAARQIVLTGSRVGYHERVRRLVAQMLGVNDVYSE